MNRMISVFTRMGSDHFFIASTAFLYGALVQSLVLNADGAPAAELTRRFVAGLCILPLFGALPMLIRRKR